MTSEIAKLHPTSMQALAPPSETGALIHMIERVARDPAANLDKVRELMALRLEIEQRNAKRAFADAMTAAQAEMTRVSADASNPQTRSKYASYAALDRAIRPVYAKHGFALSFDTAEGAREGEVRVICDVDCAGHTRRFHIDMPADGKGAKGGDVMTKTHATGSAVSYGRRYLLLMIFNIAVGDDDGNAAGGGTISDEQADAITAAITDARADIDKFLGVLKVESVSDIPAKDYVRALGLLAAKKAKLNADH